jgi:hypothetical protein
MEEALSRTDEVDPQWKRIMSECRVKVVCVLSAAAKGKSSGLIAGFRTGSFGYALGKACVPRKRYGGGVAREVRRYNEH